MARLRLPFAAGVAVLALAAGASSASAETARPADDFFHSIGVNTHAIYDDTAYGRFDIVKSRLQELGVRHIRDGICGTCNWQWDRYNQLAQLNIGLDAVVGRPTDSATVFGQNIAALKRLTSVDMVEGANEWDNSGRSTWVSEESAHQQRLWNAVHADPALASKPVVGPSLVFSWTTPSSWDKLGDQSGWMTYGNSHGYPGGRPPENNVDAEITRARKVSGTKPLVMSESGYHNALQQANNDHPAVSERVAASYIARLLLENYRKGVARTYLYELLDERPGLAATRQEQSFGLLRADYTAKPAFTAVKNLLTLFADHGTAIPAADVAVTVTSGAGDLRRLVLRRRDGRVYVVLWRAASLWDTGTRTPVTVSSVPATVQFGGAVSSVTAYRPVTSAAGAPVAASGGAVTVAVGGDPVVLEKR